MLLYDSYNWHLHQVVTKQLLVLSEDLGSNVDLHHVVYQNIHVKFSRDLLGANKTFTLDSLGLFHFGCSTLTFLLFWHSPELWNTA